MNDTTVTKIEGHTLLDLPEDESAKAFWKMDDEGNVHLKFTNYHFTQAFMHQAVRGQVIDLMLNYSYAVPVIKKDMSDLTPLPEDVRGHAMRDAAAHDDGRVCSFHHRLGVFTPDGLNECHREHRFTGSEKEGLIELRKRMIATRGCPICLVKPGENCDSTSGTHMKRVFEDWE